MLNYASVMVSRRPSCSFERRCEASFSTLRINHWLPAQKPKIYRSSQIQLVAKEKSGLNNQKLLFRALGKFPQENRPNCSVYCSSFRFVVVGPDHMGIFLAPKTNVRLINWSFVEGEVLEGPIWKDNRTTHFIFYSHGLSPSQWEFWLELEVKFFSRPVRTQPFGF